MAGDGAGDGSGGAPRRLKGKLCREEVAVVLAAVATAVVLVQRFVDEHSLLVLLPGNAAAALESSMQATSSALAKLQTMFSLTAASDAAAAAADPAIASDDDRQLHSSSSSLRKAVHAMGDTIAPPRFHDVFQSGDDVHWKASFRMSRASFARLLEILGPVLERQEPADIPADRKLAATLYRLAHGATIKVVARKFGISTGSCSKAFYDVCKGLEEKLGHLFDFPTSSERLTSISGEFAAVGLPHCCGALGCTNFAVERPPGEMGIDYFDHTRNYSVVMQGVVDSRSRFLDISVGWPGCIPPAAILLKTRFYSRVRESHELLQGPPLDLGGGIFIPRYVLGDRSYNLQPWLITPYSQPEDSSFDLTALFNKAHRHAMRPLRRAFGMLKEQWQLLKTTQRVDSIELLPFIVAASCVLQNFLIDNGEAMPEVEEELEQREPAVVDGDPDVYGESVRSALAGFVGQYQTAMGFGGGPVRSVGQMVVDGTRNG
ncbi:protein ANTAGONIST OF LIKE HETEROCHROMATIN PROTEIN 1-like [Selaginella moellendorffii]|uniref:protein ANTAGONIST OF LIKE HETEROCHROMATIN PROTEIN 1-like n=1 Tax=Selaginella moellendorffii TaxID=88036 RepID=UPI000D1CFEEC|nr:protein ANTAGONIST OF LIKE HETEROCHROMATIN PROTEIN 1-like [Selaginella moellendorffii]XP_024516300.1 protein ANTAGONIST OF LIKE HETEROCHROMATIN PROTEIN 1-like [Selaginella moellendorffii]|eukprot:XP_024516299.1 protein ANTAGONIST OF LIKE HETEROCHROMATIN PROTEIN 1-like [Selaginella moellendorffii]